MKLATGAQEATFAIADVEPAKALLPEIPQGDAIEHLLRADARCGWKTIGGSKHGPVGGPGMPPQALERQGRRPPTRGLAGFGSRKSSFGGRIQPVLKPGDCESAISRRGSASPSWA